MSCSSSIGLQRAEQPLPAVVNLSNLSMEDKKIQIVDNEEFMARQLARRVIEKPVPAVWMILIPVFFVFHVWKIKQYANGLKDFAENYLISRRRALDTAFEAEQSGNLPDIDHLVEMADTFPAEARRLYRDWMSLLVDHYRFMLAAPGNSYKELIRAHYRIKSNFLLFCNKLNKTENAFNLALLPDIKGDSQDLRYILDRMESGVADLRRKEIEEIFS
jgi:hypothetical protein